MTQALPTTSPRPETGPQRPTRRLLGEPQRGTARWILALAMLGAIMATALSLRGVLAGFVWGPPSALVVAATLLPPALLRRYPVLAPFAPLGALVGWIMGLTLVFFPTTALMAVIPTQRTVEAALQLSAEAAKVIMVGSAPVPAVASMSFVVAAGLGFVALIVDTVALTLAMPAASSLGLVLIMLPPALTTDPGIGGWGFAGAAGGFLLVLGCCRWYAPEGKLRTGGSPHPSGTLSRSVALAAVVVLLMAAVPATIPGFTTGAFPQGTRLGQGSGAAQLDPMIALGMDLRSQSEQVSVTYLSNNPSAQYLRLNTLENFTGQAWLPSVFPARLDPGVTGLSPTPGVPAALARARSLTWISTAGLQSEWLPAPLSVTNIENLDGQWVWNPSTQTIKATNASTLGQSYIVQSEMPQLSQGLLSAATRRAVADVDPLYSQLPRDVPAIVGTTAEEVAGGARTPYAQALALQAYLRSGLFSYSLDTPVEGGYDGSGMSVLAAFLEKKSGYCVHFSAAMAVMARELDIPSRIAVGYAPGERTEDSGILNGQELNGFQAAGIDAHAWPELYFAGVGWVPFEPTPSRGSVPDYSLEQSTPSSNDDVSTASAGDETPTANPSAEPSTAAAAAGADRSGARPGYGLFATGVAVLAMVLLGTPALARVLVRRRRVARVRDGGSYRGATRDAPELVAWRELLATARDFGYSEDPSLTPALKAERVARLMGRAPPGALSLLLHEYERAVYGRWDESAAAGQTSAGREDLADALEKLISRMRAHATPWQLLRATLMPVSLLRSPAVARLGIA